MKVLSTVSGGSVIGALFAATDEPFAEFETRVHRVLARGLVKPAIRKVFTTSEGLKALYCWLVLVVTSSLLFTASTVAWGLSFFVFPEHRSRWRLHLTAPLTRFASRTTILRRVFEDEIHAIIVAGHGRLQAAKLLGLPKVPAITLVGLSEA